MRKYFFVMGGVVGFVFLLAFSNSSRPGAPTLSFEVDTLARGLTVPWDIVFLPDGSFLFTERPGRVRLYKNNHLQDKPLLELKDVEVRGKMGLLGACLHPQFASNSFVYLAYNYRMEQNTYLKVMRYRYLKDSLIYESMIIDSIPGSFNHTGCRLVFGPDQKLYITTGDADVPRLAQDTKALNGKILRLNDDGSIPADNPFINNDTARREIWTYGHRNSQGIAFQPGSGILFNSEHGPNHGDEVNLVQKGHNYGWPVIHHREAAEGMETSFMEFSPAIGPAEAIFYKGNAFPQLKNNLLVGCMRGEAILRIQLDGQKLVAHEFLFKNRFGRIRAVAEGPEGYIYISTSQVDPPESNLAAGSSGYDLLLRMRPAGKNLIQTPSSKKKVTSFQSGKVNKVNTNIAQNKVTPSTNNRSATVLYQQLCASCHGQWLQGNKNAGSLRDNVWKYGSGRAGIMKTIRQGVVDKGMPSWEGALKDQQIAQLTDFILTYRRKS